MKFRAFSAFFAWTLLWLLGACKPTAESDTAVFSEYRGVQVAATIPVVADLVRQIGGVRVKVDCLIPINSDPNAFQVTPEITARIARNKALFRVKLPAEEALITAAESLKSGPVIFQLGQKVPEKSLMPQAGGGTDPFFWADASLWATCIDEVLAGLVQIDPDGRDAYEQNAGFYHEKLANVHEWARRRAQEAAPEKRVIVTATQGYLYFGKAYAFDTGAVLAPANVQPIAGVILQRGIRAVFNEAGVSRDLIDQVAVASSVDVRGPLYTYGPGLPGNMETSQGESYDTGSYVGMLKHNINMAVESLR